MTTTENYLHDIQRNPNSPDEPYILDMIADALLSSDPENGDNLAFAAACYIRADEIREQETA